MPFYWRVDNVANTLVYLVLNDRWRQCKIYWTVSLYRHVFSLLPSSAQTQTQSGAVGTGGGTVGGWRPGSWDCCHPKVRPLHPQNPPPHPAATSCPPGAAGGQCHSGSHYSALLEAERRNRQRCKQCIALKKKTKNQKKLQSESS